MIHAMSATVVELTKSTGWADITISSFVPLIILLILTGRLTTAKDRDYWRDTALELLAQNHKLINGAETTTTVLRSLPGQDKDSE